MDLHYNAFISYRHHPEDIRVATEIHRLLERFKVPRALKKRGSRITRLFRDKDELPLTSSLTDSITTALENSDYLIVICSTHTGESVWVQREIETFLLTHDRSRILTVLVNGEPSEVIPEILLYQEVTDPETGETRREALEPLSCDWRMNRRRARREELPRLAAALLHCSYDELRQRQRQYRMQRLMVGGSVALAASLGLAAYFLYTSITIQNANVQIQENYTQALRNQSEYLTTAAQERMENGDQMTALSLLLEALPSEENQRPYAAKAEWALTEALGVYSEGEEIAARGVLAPDETAAVTDFLLTDDGNHIYLLDSRHIVTVWNTETLLLEATIGADFEDCKILAVTAEGNLLVRAYYGSINNYTECYSLDGTRLWQVEGYLHDIAFQGDKEVLLALVETRENQELILFLDPATGEQTREPISVTSEDGESQAYSFALRKFAFGDPLIFGYSTTISWKNADVHTYLVDPDSGEQKLLLRSPYSPDAGYTREDGKILLMASNGGGELNGRIDEMVTTSPVTRSIYCFDPKTAAAMWQSEIVSCQFSGDFALQPVPDSDTILCQAGNTIQLISAADGSLLQRCELPSAVCSIASVSQSSALGILTDGGIFRYDFEDNLCTTSYHGFSSNLRQAEIFHNVYTLALKDSLVTIYSQREPDILWEEDMYRPEELSPQGIADNGVALMEYMRALEEKISEMSYEELMAEVEAMQRQSLMFHADESYIAGDWMAYESRDEILMYDLRNHAYLWSQPRPLWGDMIGFSNDLTKFWIQDDLNSLAALDTVTGEKRIYPMPDKMNDLYVDVQSEYSVYENQVWYLLSVDQTLYLATLIPETGEVEYYPFLSTGLEVPEELAGCAGSVGALEMRMERKECSKEVQAQARVLMEACEGFQALAENARVLSAANGHAWLLTGTGALYALPLDGNDPVLVTEELADPIPIAHRASDGATAVPGKNSILLCGPDGQLMRTLDLGEDSAAILYFRGDELLCQTELGHLLWFDPEGTRLSRIDNMWVDSNFHAELRSRSRLPSDITWHETEDGKLIYIAFGVANIIDCETRDTCGSLSCFAYDPGEDVFLRNGETGLQAIHRYRLNELIELAENRLGSYTLPKEKREAYGID